MVPPLSSNSATNRWPLPLGSAQGPGPAAERHLIDPVDAAGVRVGERVVAAAGAQTANRGDRER
jgi:hypothetical protein